MGRNVSAERRYLISTTSWLVRLARSGRISAARKQFDDMLERDTVAWNAMLTAYSHSSRPLQTLTLFARMRSCGPPPDPFSFTAVVAAAAELRDLRCGRKVHALLFRVGLLSSLPVSNSLVDMYGKCSRPADAARVFEGMEERNEVSWCSFLHAYINSGQGKDAHELFVAMPHKTTIAWNVLLVGYAQLRESESCLQLFREMQVRGFEGDATTFASLITACSEMASPWYGCMVHAVAVRRGWNDATEVNNSMLSLYANFGSHEEALKIFECMASPTVISWNAMMDASMKIGDVQGALSLFRRAPETNTVSWTTMIAGFARRGYGEEALAFFVDMVARNSLGPDDFTYGAALHACAVMAVLGNGRMVHCCAIRSGFDEYLYVGNGLVNMYAKCGDIDSSSKAFDGIRAKDLVSCNAMLLGYALHGWPWRAFEVFDEMRAHDVRPDKVTFMGLLMACSHSGLVEQGGAVLETMMGSVHGLQPDAEHVTCVVDMLGRGGGLKEAAALLEGCSKAGDVGIASSSEALLGACAAARGDVSFGRKVGKDLIRLEPQKEAGYVMLSNLYCVDGRWEEAEEVRRAMMERGVKKSPGCSWIQTRDMLAVFVSGSQSPDGMTDVHDMLQLLGSEMRNPTTTVRLIGEL
ncbi:hypothetical protein BHM03_00029555 [Ensete ventricosum]|nr:hypothetical protein BHM03_00029555 [Ensete ventricosum]